MNFGEPLRSGEIEQLDFAKGGGLIPAIVQHAVSGAVLMLGYMSRESLRETFVRRRVVFFSRSKQRLWEKGETSGNSLEFVAARADCDGDSILITAHPRGPACHLGLATCFGAGPVTPGERLAFLASLESIVEHRIASAPDGSYTARLCAQGRTRIAQKIGEEAVEFALAIAAERDEDVIAEAADLLYHSLVALKSRGIALQQVIEELRSRHTAKEAVKS